MTNNFANEEQIMKYFNTTSLKKIEDTIQVQHYLTGLFHYLVKTKDGWKDTGVTSVTSEFFEKESK